MKLNKSTMVPMLVTAAVTLGLLALINNVDALGKVSETVKGDGGWF